MSSSRLVLGSSLGWWAVANLGWWWQWLLGDARRGRIAWEFTWFFRFVGNIVKYFWHHMVPLYIVHIVYIYIYTYIYMQIYIYILSWFIRIIYIYTLFINIYIYIYIYIERLNVHSTFQSIHIIRRSVQFRLWNVFFLALLYTYIDI